VGWLWNCTLLALPLLGIILSSGTQTFGDRYSYLSQVGLCISIVWFCGDLARKKTWIHAAFIGTYLIILFSLIICSYQEASYWKNTVSLMEHNLKFYTEENTFAHSYLADALIQSGNPYKAIPHIQKIVELDRTAADNQVTIEYRHKLGRLLYQSGRREAGITELDRTLKIQPGNAFIKNDLAWMLATSPEEKTRDGKRALKLIEEANKSMEGKDPSILDTLSACYAETGDYPEALRAANRARELAKQAGMRELTETLDKEITLYESGKPIRDPQ